ncbi:MAG: tannase/feruloyl esterase family alpha/beta hydrolase, partial [Deltaproteobacteria bacterium]
MVSPASAQGGQPTSPGVARCDDSLKAALGSVAGTNVVLVKQFRQGERLVLQGSSTAGASSAAVEGGANTPPPVAKTDLCMVKLLIGPGNPGSADAPSTSRGIGIEVLLPTPDRWNERIRAYGNSGWSGTPQSSATAVASDDIHAAAAGKGFVVGTSDNGHVGSPLNGSFAMKSDGTINTSGWQDFSERSLHEVAVKTKLLTRIFYGRAQRYAYWDGFSTGGRQGLKLAQAFPDDFDGILVGAPAINWSKYHTAGLYGQIAMQQDLGRLIDANKLTAVSNAAIAACGGAGLG